MNNKYNESIKKIEILIKENLKFDSLPHEFNIKDSYEIENNIDSLDWLDNISFYHNDFSFLGESISFFKYNSNSNQIDDIKKIGNYIIYTSKDKITIHSDIKEFVDEIDLNRGILLSMFLDLDNSPAINYNLDEYNVQNILDLGGDDYLYHDFKEILKLFNNIKVFKIKSKYLDSNNDLDNEEQFKFRFLGVLKCENKINRYINEYYFSEETLNVYKEIFRSSVNYFPYENLYLSLNHNSPKYIFLEVYRIFEKLYPIVYCKEIKKEWDIKDKDLFTIRMFLKRKLGWRPDEKKSINSIFDYKDELNIKQYIRNLEDYKNENSSVTNNSVGKWIYEIRNELVHLGFEESSNPNNINLKKILKDDIIIKNLVPIIFEVYKYIF